MNNTLNKYNKQVPRYTSYPTAPHFTENVSAKTYATWLKNIPEETPISLYLHIPFCKQLCWYCGCHTKITHQSERIQGYINSLIQEIQTVRSHIGFAPKVSHIHWGGGTPNYIPAEDFSRIMHTVYTAFDVQKTAEIAVECDPRVLTEDMMDAFVKEGINRLSFGVQDFDATVQKAINREQPFEVVKEKVEALRARGITSINFDLIYGLPAQSVSTIEETVRLTNILRPERVAVFGYAHVPWMKKHQKLMERFHLPTPEERRALEDATRAALIDSGYIAVGLDHFALPEDTMAKATLDGSLKRNFQGYTTDNAEYLLGFGASSISCIPNGYAQNDTDIPAYEAAVGQGQFATKRGVATSQEDVRRRQMIMELMGRYQINLSEYGDVDYTDAIIQLDEMTADNLVKWEGDTLKVTDTGRPYVRTIASVFDAYLNPAEGKHSQAI